MKYSNKRKQYEASNVTFNPHTMTAYSYGWWRFVSRIEGIVYFNNHKYSITTMAHQRKVQRLLRELGIPFITINTRKSLHCIDTENLALEAHMQQAISDKQAEENKRIARNERARKKRLEAKQTQQKAA